MRACEDSVCYFFLTSLVARIGKPFLKPNTKNQFVLFWEYEFWSVITSRDKYVVYF